MAVPVLKIAKEGKNLPDIGSVDMSLNSNLNLPKIYAGVKLTPGGGLGEIEYAHGRGYPPSFIYYQEQRYFQDNSLDTEFNPVRYIWGSQGPYFTMDATNFETDFGGGRNSRLVLFLDPLSSPAVAPSPTTSDGPRLKIGSNVQTNADYQSNIDSKYQTLKVHMVGQFSCSLPAWNATEALGADWNRQDWFSFNHNLGYPPIFAPFGISTVGLAVELAYSGVTNIPSSYLINDVNDIMVEKWAYNFGGNYDQLEGLWIYVDSSKYYVGFKRTNWDFGGGYNFPARTVTVNYTIFANSINEEFNLLGN